MHVARDAGEGCHDEQEDDDAEDTLIGIVGPEVAETDGGQCGHHEVDYLNAVLEGRFICDVVLLNEQVCLIVGILDVSPSIESRLDKDVPNTSQNVR